MTEAEKRKALRKAGWERYDGDGGGWWIHPDRTYDYMGIAICRSHTRKQALAIIKTG